MINTMLCERGKNNRRQEGMIIDVRHKDIKVISILPSNILIY
jgi:hypothetical protein